MYYSFCNNISLRAYTLYAVNLTKLTVLKEIFVYYLKPKVKLHIFSENFVFEMLNWIIK